jgi:hypothetical protein
MNGFSTVHKSGDLLSYTNGSHGVLLSFMWLKFSSFGWDLYGWQNTEWQEPKLGDAQGTPR